MMTFRSFSRFFSDTKYGWLRSHLSTSLSIRWIFNA